VIVDVLVVRDRADASFGVDDVENRVVVLVFEPGDERSRRWMIGIEVETDRRRLRVRGFELIGELGKR
jgi:hypothetical protein